MGCAQFAPDPSQVPQRAAKVRFTTSKYRPAGPRVSARMSGVGGNVNGFHAAAAAGRMAPPQNLEAEQSVLGAVLLSDTALPALIIDERLNPEDFYREAHGRIYQAMLDLHTAGEPVDALTLVEHLKQAGDLDTVGGRATIDLLAGSGPAVG